MSQPCNLRMMTAEQVCELLRHGLKGVVWPWFTLVRLTLSIVWQAAAATSHAWEGIQYTYFLAKLHGLGKTQAPHRWMASLLG